MIIRVALLAFLLFCACAKADVPVGAAAKFTFNKGLPLNDVSGQPIRTSDAILAEDRFGNPRSAYYLYGNLTSYLNLGTSSVLKPMQGTLSVWFNYQEVIYKGKGYPNNPILLTKNRQDVDFFEGYSIGYDYATKKISTNLAIDSTQQITISSKGVTFNEWHHIAVAYNNDYVWVYLDNELMNENRPLKKGFPAVFSPTDSVMVGNTANRKNSRYMCGRVDDIYIYDRVLSAQEIDALYHEPDYNRYNRYLKLFWWGLSIACGMAVMIWLLMWRYRRMIKAQVDKNRLNARLNELETKAIRMNMNPHFVFNSLNTLQHFILEEDFKKSNLYLTKLSSLLRRLIESSLSDFISLSEEMDILKSYLEIESLRFDNSFRNEVSSDVAQPDHVYIPFMLVQPFVENAIWHGLLPKKGDRFVSVRFLELDKDKILCEIEDNGMGRQNRFKSNNPFKKKSMAIDFIRQRLELLEKSTGIACGLKMEDKVDAEGKALGTKVSVVIPKVKYENTHHHY